jgi:hypothetical protein
MADIRFSPQAIATPPKLPRSGGARNDAILDFSLFHVKSQGLSF